MTKPRPSKDKGYKLFVLRKYVRARNVPEAIKLAKAIEYDDVYVSDDWKESKSQQLAAAIGFESYPPSQDNE